MNDLAPQIETFLRNRKGWVSSDEICAQFHIRERALRAIGSKPGFCSEFAISGDKGFRHVVNATDAEFERFESRIKTHAIGELIRRQKLRRLRRQLLSEAKAQPAITRDGQALLFNS